MKTTGSPSRTSLRLLFVALLVLAAVLAQLAVAQNKAAAERPKPVVLDEKARAFGPEANPDVVMKETRGRTAIKSRGLEVRQLHGREAGMPISSLPGAKSIDRRQWMEMKEIPKTGLYLFDLDHVPPGLEDQLKRDGYQLAADGTLTQNGKPVALFVHGETFHIKPSKRASGLTETLSNIASGVESLFVTEAKAATPFPWACGSWNFRWQYDGGFCRDYKAWSDAYAWGAGPGGGCSDPKPLTRIQYISTYASVGSHTGFDYHYSADQAHAYATWDIGCFWPAHGTGSGYHYAYWRDGSAWMYRTWSW